MKKASTAQMRKWALKNGYETYHNAPVFLKPCGMYDIIVASEDDPPPCWKMFAYSSMARVTVSVAVVTVIDAKKSEKDIIAAMEKIHGISNQDKTGTENRGA